MPKRYLGIDVLTAARARIGHTFDTFSRVYVSFSGGKDSTVLLDLAAIEARTRGRRLGLLFVDLEGQYRLTIEHALQCIARYADVLEPYWICLPIALRNAVSQYQPKWLCWDPACRSDWIREPPPRAIVDPAYFAWFRSGMEFEEFIPRFGEFYSVGQLTACLVGIRSDESLNRYRTVTHRTKQRFEGLNWTTYVGGTVFNAYPIYDWRTADIWTYCGKTGLPYNRLYDLMHRAGLSIHQQRICQPYGDDQRKGLWLFHLIEPDTWARVVARVNGANQGALYALGRGNINGTIKVTLPEGHTWQSFADLLLSSMPGKSREHFECKVAVFLKWWRDRGIDPIPDEADPKEEAGRNIPSWRRICKAMLRNDYWCKGLGFSQTNSAAYEKYLKMMKGRKQRWDLEWWTQR